MLATYTRYTVCNKNPIDPPPPPPRVNVGGLHTASYLHRLLALKYPALQTHITLSRVQEVLSHHCSVSLDYPGDLRTWAARGCQDGYRVIQLPFSQVRNGMNYRIAGNFWGHNIRG